MLFPTSKREGNEEEGEGSRNLYSPPFSPKSLDFPKIQPDWCAPYGNFSQQDCASLSGIPLPAESFQSQHLTLEGRLGSRIPQIEGAAILRIRAPFPKLSFGCVWSRVCTGRKKERKKREETRKPDLNYGEKVNFALTINERGGYSPVSLSDS